MVGRNQPKSNPTVKLLPRRGSDVLNLTHARIQIFAVPPSLHAQPELMCSRGRRQMSSESRADLVGASLRPHGEHQPADLGRLCRCRIIIRHLAANVPTTLSQMSARHLSGACHGVGLSLRYACSLAQPYWRSHLAAHLVLHSCALSSGVG